ncbi:DUF979 family protein [Pseudoalteromonas sp. B137]
MQYVNDAYGSKFNILPAALLDLKDKCYVIKVQIQAAVTLLAVNIILMYSLVCND